VVLRAAARLVEHDPALRERLVVLVVGGASGSGLAEPAALAKLAGDLGISDLVRFEPPADQVRLADIYRAATVTLVPSHNESFGLVALESQACGTPVVAAAVGGLRTAVSDGQSGLLIPGHDPDDYAAAVRRIVGSPSLRHSLAEGAVAHASQFGWSVTAAGVLETYREALEAARFAQPLAAVAR
jgi:D-inositol-3-phosphate glycosyltransferase